MRPWLREFTRPIVLYGRLIHGYNRQLRPVRRPDVPVRVQLGASLVEVLGLDEAHSHITLKIWLTLVRVFIDHYYVAVLRNRFKSKHVRPTQNQCT